MIASKVINATVHKPSLLKHHWKHIPWRKVIECVRRLQIRIAKAWLKGDYGTVKDLQRLLLKSFYARLLAVKRVTSNKGSKTPGIDKVLWLSPITKMNAAIQLGKGPYKPSPLRRIHIPKKNGKTRPLGIPTMPDRAEQALHLMTLEPISESTGDKHSYGFRPCRSTADAIAQCFTILARKDSPQYILEGDIKACFDEISHEWMLKHIPMDKETLRKMLKAGYMEKGIFHVTEVGTVQGGIISPTLANMVLDGIENYLKLQFGNRLKSHKVHFIRYADDFVITANSEELLVNEIKPSLENFLNARGLRLSKEKTIVTHIQKGFTFLGQTIRKFKDKLIIKPSDKSIESLLDKIRDICNEHKQAKTGFIIEQLNPIIRGWANYHRHVVSSATFTKVDSEIHKILWRWVKRRHPNKNRSWIKEKYFKSFKDRNWVFSNDSDEEVYHQRLFRASEIKIKRHIKLKQDANPFDEKWEIYFERRVRNKLLERRNGRKHAQYLLGKQNNLCALCKENISSMNLGEYHFKQHWMHGGSHQDYNLMVVHPKCHESLHARIDNELGPQNRGLTEGLEPYDGKLSCTVLRGEELVTI